MNSPTHPGMPCHELRDAIAADDFATAATLAQRHPNLTGTRNGTPALRQRGLKAKRRNRVDWIPINTG